MLLPYPGRLLLAGLALLVVASTVLILAQGLRLVIDRGMAADAAALRQTPFGLMLVVSVLAAASPSRVAMPLKP